jgi:hypothetical protein
MTPIPDTPRDADLHRTRRAFLFAREQVAAQTKGYQANRRVHRWAAYRQHGEDPTTAAPYSHAR